MMTAEFMLSKRPVLRFTAALFFLLKLFSSHIYCICILFARFRGIRAKGVRLIAMEEVRNYGKIVYIKNIFEMAGGRMHVIFSMCILFSMCIFIYLFQCLRKSRLGDRVVLF